MKTNHSTIAKIGLAIALSLPFSLAQAQPSPNAPSAGPGAGPGAAPAANANTVASTAAAAASANLATSKVTSPPAGKTAAQSRRTGGDPVDDRVELRTYHFTNTDEELPYAVFVSSKVAKDQKAPLVLALHGFSGNHGTFMRTGCVEEAEKNGYILVGAMGYSPSAPFGATMGGRGPGRRGGAPTNAPAMTPPAQGTNQPARGGVFPGSNAVPGAAPRGRGGMAMMGGRSPAVGGTKETDPAKVSALSEIDTMNVLFMALKEFNVDENRIFLMGHSMGGMGAMHIGEKYAPMWAAVACLAGFGSPDPKGKMKDTPLYFTAGSLDSLGSRGRTVAEQLKAEGMNCEWKEVPGLDHGGIIAGAMPDVFKFFNEHSKPAPKNQ
ncbi:MAG: alpha/beta hydrolase-fold protein [Verrucomicrobiota bacterium]|jgi:predicted esterase